MSNCLTLSTFESAKPMLPNTSTVEGGHTVRIDSAVFGSVSISATELGGGGGGLGTPRQTSSDHAGPLHVTINVYNDLFGYAGGIYTQPSPTSKAGHSSKLCDGILLRMLRSNILGYARGHGSSLCERWIERALAVVGGCL